MAELTRRYIVMPMGTEGPFDRTDPDAPFVLKPWKDPAALLALEAYRAACYPELSRELSEWIGTIRSGAVPPGSVGARNAAHLASRTGAAGPRDTSKAKPKVMAVKKRKNKAKAKNTTRKATRRK